MDPFHDHALRYDQWYDRHPTAYTNELTALRTLLPPAHRALEVGVGSGRFAVPLAVEYGVDPSLPMLRMAQDRGLHVAAARAEALPFPPATFDLVLMVTTLCFLTDRNAFLNEAGRTLTPRGHLLLGLIDWGAPAAREHLAQRRENPFYRYAHPTPAAEIDRWLERCGWRERIWVQTLSEGIDTPPETPRAGFGEGLFAVVRARRP